MAFLLSHWHCIVPLAAILIGVFFMNRGEKKSSSQSTRAALTEAEKESQENTVHEL